MEQRKIILDVDTGSDDAVVLTLAMHDSRLKILGICTVNGNLECKLTTDNTLRVVEYCEKQNSIGVHMGCDEPLVCTLQSGSAQYGEIPRREKDIKEMSIHKKHLPLPPAAIQAQAQRAVPWLIETLNASDGDVTIVAVGPLTNVAAALRADPAIAAKTSEIIFMGGGDCRSGLVSPAAEFNVWCDPEATEIVIQSGCKITMVPLDATYQAKMSRHEID